MLRPILWATLTVATVLASGDLIILHSPVSVEFHGEQPLDQSDLKEVFTTALGFTPKVSNWHGMQTKDFDDLPEAIVGIAIEGMEHLESPRGMKYPLNNDEAEEITWQALSGRLHDRGNDNTLIRIHVGDGVNHLGRSALGELKPTSIDALRVKSLNLGNETDRKILDQIVLLHAIARNVRTAITTDGNADVYWFVVSGMPQLIELHRKDPHPVKEALHLLNNAINDVSEAFMQAYNNNVLIAAFTASNDDSSKSRQTRSVNLERERREAPSTKMVRRKAAKRYSQDYPVIFNIFLWFGVVFVFSLLAVCIVIADMDPGRDSIIYRMTSTRMKKDN